jgi:HEAT repeat protein
LSSNNEICLEIFERGLESPFINVQDVVASLFFLFDDDRIEPLLHKALGNQNYAVRMIAVRALTLRHHGAAYDAAVSLMPKCPEYLIDSFPQLFAEMDTPEADRELKKMLHSSNEEIRLSALSALINEERDDFIETVKTLSTQPHYIQQEMCAFILGEFGSQRSIPYVEKLLKSPDPFVRLTARMGLNSLKGYEEIPHTSPWDIELLNDQQLSNLFESGGNDEQLSAALRLLIGYGDPKGINRIKEAINNGSKFYTHFSPGGCLHYWSFAKLTQEDCHSGDSFSLFLPAICETDPALFLDIAKEIMSQGTADTDVLSATVFMLEEMNEEPLIREGAEKIGAPFLRNLCQLSLYRTKGEYEHSILAFLSKHRTKTLARHRLSPQTVSDTVSSPHELSDFQISKIQTEAFRSIAEKSTEKEVKIFLKSIADSPPANKQILAGLLLYTLS